MYDYNDNYKGGETMDYEKLGLITDEEMSELSKVETDGVMGDTDELKSATAGAAAGGAAGGAASASGAARA